ncbi:MAG: aminotransferase class V-fold PLP-dependent enzyme [Candidatus Methanomethylophilaceae archaeon]|nr:aminotransferase class V-fold PLP-dependent enzyme [Candidatus Methanomethylophilaceae archaeon]MDY5872480.1 aminotransferase class V-fold PLP-dependent enzyme [Candidatus Methanomethylophilaceae archaeon]
MARQLFTVGPVYVEDETLQAQTKPMITHRCKEYKALHGAIVEKIRKCLGTDDDVFLVGGSATVLIEGAVRNAVNSKSLGISNGSFGKRLIECGTANGKDVEQIHVPWGTAMKPEHIEGKVAKDIEAVHWVSNESSTGVLSDSVALAEEVRRQNPDALIIVDAVTSAMAADLRVPELRPDALVFGTQKALALPPGLAIAVVSDRIIEKSKSMSNKGFYTDFVKLKKNADDNYALTTPPVSLMYALDWQLDRILAEGMQTRYRRHDEMAKLVQDWAEKNFNGLFPEEGYRSKTIGVVNRGDLDFDAFHNALKAKGYEISNGYGDVKSSTFRIGHMGDTTPDMIKKLLSAMDEVLEEMQ